MSTRRNSRQTARRRATAARRFTPYSLYRRALRIEPLEDRQLLAVVTVNTLSDTTNLTDNLTTLREAIFATNTVPGADTINFAPALTANGPATIVLTQGELKITDSLTISGPGANLLTIDASGSDPTPDQDNGDGSRIFNVDNGSASANIDVAIDAITLTGGDIRGNGGAILTVENLALSRAAINNNAATGNGGGIHSTIANSGTVHIDGTTIALNSSRQNGGGLYLTVSPTGTAIIEHSRISNNVASTYGGGLYGNAQSAELHVIETTIANNAAYRGGGARLTSTRSSSITVQRSTINDNQSVFTGGGLEVVTLSRGSFTLEQSTISSNTSTSGAGGIDFGQDGGGESIVRLLHSTVTNNTTNNPSSQAGSGIRVYAQVLSLVFDHTIVAGNGVSGAAPDFSHSAAVKPSSHHSLIGFYDGPALTAAPIGTPDANGNLVGGPIHGFIDPLLGPLADNGGLTFTHALLPGSPAINAGDLSAVAGVNGVSEFDQRGTPFGRVFNGRIDIGAFEYQQPSDLNLLVDTLVDENDGNFTRGDLSLREAIALANMWPGVDTIHFDPALTAAGPAKIVLTQGELKITDSLTINGPGGNLLTIDASGSDPTPGIVNGDGSRVFNIDDGVGTASIVSISGLKLTGGDVASNGGAVFTRESLSLIDMVIDKNFSTSTSSGGAGGGFAAALNNGAAVTISRSIISNNQSTARGGGISLDVGPGGSALISNSQIVGNSKWLPSSQATNYAGGGIYVSNLSSRGPVAIEDSLVFGNRSDGSGGGISSSGPIVITNSTIASNSSLRFGGGIHSQVSPSFSQGFTLADSHVTDNFGRDGGGIAIGGLRGPIHTITRTTISRNMALNQNGRGGGVYVQQGDLQIADSTISENFAVSDGGGIFSSSMILMEGTTINNNVAGNGGGGISLPGGGTIRESTITGNSAKTGGGLYANIFPGPAAPPTTTVSHSTIANNRASTNAGGVYVTAMKLNLDHSIVANNTSPSRSDASIGGFGGQITAAYSLIGDNNGSGLSEAPIGAPDANGNLIGGAIHGLIDPQLGPLADNGGPTFTHALLAGSPAINAGNLSAVAGVNGVPQFDQRSTPFGRVFNGRIDIGAFELQPEMPLGDFNLNGIVDSADYTLCRNTMGSTLDLRADGNGDGVVDNADYQIWRANFGDTRLGISAGTGSQPIAAAAVAALNTNITTTASDESRLARASAVQVLPPLVASPEAMHRRAVFRVERAPEQRASGLLAWLANRESASTSHQPAKDRISPSRVANERAETASETEAVDEAFATLLKAAW